MACTLICFGLSLSCGLMLVLRGNHLWIERKKIWGGKLEFGFSDQSFPKEIEDYFLLMEDECSTHSHNCGGRVTGVVFNMLDSVLKSPSYDPGNIVDFVDKYIDALPT